MEAMTAMDPNAMADLVGPFYEPSTVAERLGCRVEDLDERAATGQLLGLRTSDGVQVYPAFQFTPAGTVRPELVPVLILFAGAPPWFAAVWLRTRNVDLNGTAPEEWLAAGGDPETVQVLAGHRAFELSA